MSGETCKFCGAADHYEERFERGTFKAGVLPAPMCDTMIRSLKCYESELAILREQLARFRTMFPVIMPDDPRPITAEVCEALGMQAMLVAGYQWADIQWYPNDTMSEVWVGEEPCNAWCTSAGQLACLVAARRNSNKKGLENASASGG